MKLRPLDFIVGSASQLELRDLKDLCDMIEDDVKILKENYRAYNRKDFQIGVRVTAEEYAYVQAQARKMNVSMSAVVRYMMLVCMKVIENDKLNKQLKK